MNQKCGRFFRVVLTGLIGFLLPAVRAQAGQIGGEPLWAESIAGGGDCSLGLKSDGTIVAWGGNNYGQLNVTSPNTNFTAVSVGYNHVLGLKADGTIVAWGSNDYGQLNVPSPNANFVAVAAGRSHSLGLKADGTIITWGMNNYGQRNVPSPNTNFTAIAAGTYFSVGLKSDGTLVGWGNSSRSTVPSPNTNFVAIAAGVSHGLAVRADGTIATWGSNDDGQRNVPSPNTNFVAVAAGYGHSLGLKSDGTVVCWGDNYYGQRNVPSPNTNFVAIAVGLSHSLGLKADGTIVGWGNGYYGQTTTPSPNADFGILSYGVFPNQGSRLGGYTVVISGTNLCNGTLGDVTNVTLCGTSVSSIDSVSGSTQIVVTAAAGAPGIGNVAVYSASTGTTVKTNGFTYLKTDQTISFPNLGKQEVTNTIGLSATATSLLDVSFSVASGPAELSGGTNLSFTGAGHVVLLADQAGDGNWNAAPTVTNAFDVIGVITNVTPASGTRYTEHEVTISGLWLGSGTDITNVMLCDVSAVIITQGIHSVTVMAGLSPVATNGDVFVQSAGFGTVVLTNGFSYLPVPPPPVALSAVDITADRFTARWTAAESATNYLIDVSETNAFTTFTGIYSNWSFGDVTAGLVTGLTDGVTYYYRVRAANSYGSSLDSNIIEVPVSTNTPYILYEVTNGVASAGSSDVIDLTKLFYGSGMSYSIISNSNPSLVTATLNGSELILSYAASVTGSADITVRTTDLSNGFYVDNTITVHVVPEPGENIGAITLNPQTGLFEQTITVSNTSPTLAARAVTLTVTNLTSGAELYNATGTDEHGNPEILWIGTLDPLTAMDFTLQYYTATRGTAPTGTVIVSLSLESPQTAVSGTAFNLSGTPQNISGTQSFLIEFGATPGRTYYIQYTDALSNPWKTVQPPIVAPVNRIQWIDSGPPGTESAPGAVSNRFYRILEKTQN